jgi:hypothetical protein
LIPRAFERPGVCAEIADGNPEAVGALELSATAYKTNEKPGSAFGRGSDILTRL